MNYLAHAYLSFLDPSTTVGNLISDFVKGKKKFDYPPGIQKGIALHRSIDEFTDNHFATHEAKSVLRPHYRLYSGAFVDVIYDHFLANDINEFSEKSLMDYSQSVYSILDDHYSLLPEGFAAMLPYMKSQNWLYHYLERWGTGKSFEGLVRRASYISESLTAYRIFEEHYQLFESCYRQFWKDMRPFALSEHERLKTT